MFISYIDSRSFLILSEDCLVFLLHLSIIVNKRFWFCDFNVSILQNSVVQRRLLNEESKKTESKDKRGSLLTVLIHSTIFFFFVESSIIWLAETFLNLYFSQYRTVLHVNGELKTGLQNTFSYCSLQDNMKREICTILLCQARHPQWHAKGVLQGWSNIDKY